jgi:hypothetical protein
MVRSRENKVLQRCNGQPTQQFTSDHASDIIAVTQKTGTKDAVPPPTITSYVGYSTVAYDDECDDGRLCKTFNGVRPKSERPFVSVKKGLNLARHDDTTRCWI